MRGEGRKVCIRGQRYTGELRARGEEEDEEVLGNRVLTEEGRRSKKHDAKRTSLDIHPSFKYFVQAPTVT